jgi:DNA-binding Lrp family transcriptional regulator
MKAYMCLSCKSGAYNRVLEELLKLRIPKGNIFLLLGPMDVLVQFTGLQSLAEFIEKWFNPIRMIGAEEALVTKSMTLIVIHEGPSYIEEPLAFVFLNTQPRNLEKLQKALLAIPQVISADTVFGPYDLVCAIRGEDRIHLEQVISQIHKDVPGIEGTMMAVVASLRI